MNGLHAEWSSLNHSRKKTYRGVELFGLLLSTFRIVQRGLLNELRVLHWKKTSGAREFFADESQE